MNNAEWMLKNGYKFRELDWICDNAGDYGYVILLKNKCVGKVKDCYSTKAISTWLDMERVEPILDDAEKHYLSAVIRPFRDRAIFVKKIYHTGNYEQIIMRVKSIATDTDFADIPFPFFKKGTMYKGMELGKEYTLEELGL